MTMSSQIGDGHDHHHAERATTIVLVLTLVTMAVEIAAGWWTGSMALLADGWHMGMHAAAMGVAVLPYRFARRRANAPRYGFGAGKAADLGGYTNAVLLAVVAVLIAGTARHAGADRLRRGARRRRRRAGGQPAQRLASLRRPARSRP
jgi:Co/Zn/Cd efflux system component